MVRDALIEADAVWNGRLAKCIDDPQDFELITDCILKDVEVSKDPAMAKAQAIVRDLKKRRLYAFVDECVCACARACVRAARTSPERPRRCAGWCASWSR